MKKLVKFNLARAGVHGSVEDFGTLSEKALKQIVTNFETKKVPLIKGHAQAEDKQALGYLKEIELDTASKELKGIAEFNNESLFKEVTEGFNNWSIGIKRSISDKSWYLTHVAFLGGVQGKVKGLGQLEEIFSEDIKNYIINLNFSKKEKKMSENEKLEEELTKKIEKIFSEKLKTSSSELERLKTENASLKKLYFESNLKAFSEDYRLNEGQQQAISKLFNSSNEKLFSDSNCTFDILKQILEPYKSSNENLHSTLTTNFSENIQVSLNDSIKLEDID